MGAHPWKRNQGDETKSWTDYNKKEKAQNAFGELQPALDQEVIPQCPISNLNCFLITLDVFHLILHNLFTFKF